MTLEDLKFIPSITMLGPADDLQEQEMGFKMQASVPAADGVFTEQVEIEVRCPHVNNLILLNQATVYRTDGEELPIELTTKNLQSTLGAIISTYKRAREKRLAATSENAIHTQASAEKRALTLITQAAEEMQPLGIEKFLQLCGQAWASHNPPP